MNCEQDKIWIIIPAYNEGSRLGKVLDGLTPTDLNIVVVNDGSKDHTEEVALGYDVHVLTHVLNRGQGAALQTGLEYALQAGAEYLVMFDADGQHQATDIEKMVSPIKRGECEITLGTRFLDNTSNVPLFRRVVLQVARFITWVFSGLLLTDAHNGFRAFSRKAALEIHLRQDRMAHASEIIDQIRASKLKFREIPVTIRYTAETLAKGQSATGAANVLFHYLFGKFSK